MYITYKCYSMENRSVIKYFDQTIAAKKYNSIQDIYISIMKTATPWILKISFLIYNKMKKVHAEDLDKIVQCELFTYIPIHNI